MPANTNLALVPAPAPPVDEGVERWKKLEPKDLDRRVFSCRSAARAKGVPLEHELKSLLIAYDGDYLVAHVRGNRRLSLRAVKNEMEAEQARLADPADLNMFDVSRGTLFPFKDTLWAKPQLITEEVLELDWVTTNYGDLSKYVEFPPRLLLKAADHRVGHFEKPLLLEGATHRVGDFEE